MNINDNSLFAFQAVWSVIFSFHGTWRWCFLLYSWSPGLELLFCEKKKDNTRSKFGNKNRFTKKSEHSQENNLPQAKKILGFAKCFSEFPKGIYETCDCNSFNLAITIIIVVFLIVQFLFYFSALLAIISKEPWNCIAKQHCIVT